MENNYIKKNYSVIYFLTWKCNLNCSYCYESNKSSKKMSWEIAKNGVDFFMRLYENINIQFFGGEPLLEFDLMKKITNYLKNNYINRYGLSIYTNGTLINNEIIDYFVKNNVFITLSIDGREETQNENRRFKNNKGTFGILEKIIKKLVNQNINVRIRMTITPNNCNKLFDNMKYFYETYGIKDIQEEVDRFAIWNEEQINILIDQYNNIINYIVNFYELDKLFYWINYEKRVLPFINQVSKRKGARCGSSEGMCSMDTDGTLYPCQKFIVNQKLSIGNIYQGYNEVQREIVRNYILPNFLKETRGCKNCEFVNICFAGCIAENYIQDTNQIQDCIFRKLHSGMHKKFYDELKKKNISMRSKEIFSKKNIIGSEIKINNSVTCGAEGCGMEGGCGSESCSGEGCGAEGCGMEGGCGSES